MSFCEHCISGVRHEGETEGAFEHIGGIECYVGTPTKDYDKTKVLLYLPDAFGLPLKNNQLLVDDFARNGYKTVAMDYFLGNPVPQDALVRVPGAPGYGEPGTFDVLAWGKSVMPGARPALDQVINALKEQGVTSFAATGYCFGGRFVFNLAFDNVIKVAIASHPSALQCPADLEKFFATAKMPFLLNTCEFDPQFTKEHQAQADDLFGGGKYAPGYERTYWEGCQHGFAVRGDLSDPKVKAGKEGSFEATVKFLRKHF